MQEETVADDDREESRVCARSLESMSPSVAVRGPLAKAGAFATPKRASPGRGRHATMTADRSSDQRNTQQHSMNPPNEPRKPAGEQVRQGHRLIQMGVGLFLIALLTGLVVHKMPLPRLALSAHLLGIMQGTFLSIVGLLWPRLKLGKISSKITFLLLVYGCLAAWFANFLGAIWAAGGSMVPFAAGNARGTPLEEGIIKVGLSTAAVSLILALLFLLWGLRLGATSGPDPRSRSAV